MSGVKDIMSWIINQLYTNRSSSWISKLNDEDIQPYVIQRFLVMNDFVRVQARWLDKYVFCLPSKMYLSLAWSVLPKTDNAPFVPYIKKLKSEEEFDFILKLIRKEYRLSDNDFNSIRLRLINAIKNDMVNWFSYYGIPKRFWKKYQLNFNLIKKFGDIKTGGQSALAKWGL